MSALRKLERRVVKANLTKEHKSVKRGFEDSWKAYRESKYVTKDADGNVISDKTPRNTMPKKRVRFDNVEQYQRLFAFIKGMRADKTEEVTAVTE